MQLEPAAVAQRQVPDHRHDRRDPDAPGDEQELLRLVGEREVVLRCGARKHCAFVRQASTRLAEPPRPAASRLTAIT
jgi:hypothetical protein